MDTLIDDKIPLVIGVTGHRNLHPAELPKIKLKIKEIFNFLKGKYPNTPLLLISPLAEGADRLVAQVAVEENIRFIVPFPLPKEEYCRDFKTEESQREFSDLLSKSIDHFELPILNENIQERTNTPRKTQYALTEAYVARHSHILIALWDGCPREDIGGTYQVIQCRLKGSMLGLPTAYTPQNNVLDFIDTGNVCHIKVSRIKNEEYPDSKTFVDAGEVYILSPEEPNNPKKNLELLLSDDFRNIELFNQDVKLHFEQYGELKFEPLLKKELLDRLPMSFHIINKMYEVATVLSIKNRVVTDKAIFHIFLLSILMVTSIEFYAHPIWLDIEKNEHPSWVLVIYLSLFTLVYAIFWKTNKQNTLEKYLTYRALAEVLRIQFFWLLGGLNESVTDFYLRKHRYELAWIRNSLRSLTLYNWVNNIKSHEIVRDKWIRGQIKYFKSYLYRKNLSLIMFHVTTKILFGIGFILAFILLILGIFYADWLHKHHTLQSFFIILMFLLPAIGAAVDGYVEKIGVENNLKRYQQILEIFQRADNYIINDFEENFCKDVFVELGKISLEEINDLVLTHKQHPVDLPKG